MRKAVRKAVERWWIQDRHLLAHFVENGINPPAAFRIVVKMDTKIEQGKFQLPQDLHTGLEIPRGDHLVEQRLRQGFTGFVMT